MRDESASVADLTIEAVEANESKPPASELFVVLMASINPFAKFLIQEVKEEQDAPLKAMKAKEAEELASDEDEE